MKEKKEDLFHIWGFWCALTSNPGERKYKAVRPHHRSDLCLHGAQTDVGNREG